MRRLTTWLPAMMLAATAGCFGSPTPLAPGVGGSVGLPHHGVLTGGKALPARGAGYVRFRRDEVRWGNPRLVDALTTAAAEVERRRPGGAPLVIADLSARHGGRVTRHRSHRTGRDADLLLYALTPDGRPVRAPGFFDFGPDGLAPDGDGGFVRLDTERVWLLVRSLLTSPSAHVQWLFVARWVEALVIEHAAALGEGDELLYRASKVMHQPSDGFAHADHIHVRLACTPEEEVAGCMGGGYRWPWLPELAAPPVPDDELLSALLDDDPPVLAGVNDPTE